MLASRSFQTLRGVSDWQDCCYDVVLPENLARTAKYLKITNVSMGHAREFEIRTLKKGGMLIMMK